MAAGLCWAAAAQQTLPTWLLRLCRHLPKHAEELLRLTTFPPCGARTSESQTLCAQVYKNQHGTREIEHPRATETLVTPEKLPGTVPTIAIYQTPG